MELAKALWRAAINPAAVYGRSGRPYASSTVASVDSGAEEPRPVLRHCAAGCGTSDGVWHSPSLPTWVLRHGGCSVADKALAKYGERSVESALSEVLVTAADSSAVFHVPTIDDVFEAETLDEWETVTVLADEETVGAFHNAKGELCRHERQRRSTGKLTFGAVSVGWHDEHDYPAVPLAYLWRRYGAERLKWRQTGDGMLSAWLSDAPAQWKPLCVGLIAPCKLRREEAENALDGRE